MTPQMMLHFELLSDATFGRGDGVPGEVHAETQHDALGLPYLGGRTLKGLLAMECADTLFALGAARGARWRTAAEILFGSPGSDGSATGALIVGDARLPEKLRKAVAFAVEHGIPRRQILASLTAIRRQTASDIETGAPLDQTLRAMRVVLRGTVFAAPLRFRTEVSADALGLLAASAQSFRRLGTGRHRGRGEIKAWLTDTNGESLGKYFEHFSKEVQAP